MIPLNVKNVWLVIKACYYNTFHSNIISLPKDINEHECVLGCLIYAFSWIVIFITITIEFALLMNYLFTL